jgi:hypothetical protein
VGSGCGSGAARTRRGSRAQGFAAAWKPGTGHGGVRQGQRRWSAAGRGGPFGMARWQASLAKWPAASGLRQDRAREREKGEGEREGREKRAELNSILLKFSCGGSKNFEYESCLKFKILQLHFRQKFI